ncbi:unnamed protein product, partial [marine sediment metagenome]
MLLASSFASSVHTLALVWGQRSTARPAASAAIEIPGKIEVHGDDCPVVITGLRVIPFWES